MTQRESFNVWRDHYLSEGMGPREADLEASKRIVEACNQQKLRPTQGWLKRPVPDSREDETNESGVRRGGWYR